MEVNLSDRSATLAGIILHEEVRNNLIDPKTGKYYPDKIKVARELQQLGTCLKIGG